MLRVNLKLIRFLLKRVFLPQVMFIRIFKKKFLISFRWYIWTIKEKVEFWEEVKNNL